MKKLLLILFVTVSIFSCITPERCNDKFPPSSTENIVKETVTNSRDTTIYVYIKADTVHDTIKVYVDRNGLVQSAESYQHTQYAWSKAFVQDSKLYHETGQFEAEIAKTIKDAIQKTTQSTAKESVEVPKPIVTNILTGWQWTQIYLGRIFGLILIIYFGFKIIKMQIKIPGV